MRAIVAERVGGPEVMALREVPPPDADGRVLIDVASAGVNFADASSTLGKYAASPPPPFIPGLEVAGTDASGRPVLALLVSGGYSERVAADPGFVFDAGDVDLRQAGGSLLVSFTAYLGLHHLARLRPGETVLVTAAAGGLGSTAIQTARALGAGRVIGVASTEEKRRFALGQGADQALSYEDELPEVDLVVDGVGGETFERCLKAIRHLGRMLTLGASAGTPPVIASWDGLRRSNVAICAMSFGMFRRAHPELVRAAGQGALELLRSGRVKPPVTRALPLAEAPEAHRVLTTRQTMGKLILLP